MTDANSAALFLVPLFAYACAECLKGLLDAHRLVRMHSRAWTAADYLGVTAGKALALSAAVLVSGLVVALPQVPAETVTPQLALAFLGILARQALFFLVCAALMLAAYAPASLVPAAVVAALAYGSVGYLLQGRITASTLLDRWGWLCALPPHNVPDAADALACMAKYAATIVALASAAALALRRRDMLGEGGGPANDGSETDARRWAPRPLAAAAPPLPGARWRVHGHRSPRGLPPVAR